MTLNLVDNKEVVVLDNWVETIPWTDKAAKALHGVLSQNALSNLIDDADEINQMPKINLEEIANMLFEIADLQQLLLDHGAKFQKNLQAMAESDIQSIQNDLVAMKKALTDIPFKMQQLVAMRTLLFNKQNAQSNIVFKEGREWFVVPVEKKVVEKVS